MSTVRTVLARHAENLQTALAEFVLVEAASAIVLLAVTALALAVANSPLGHIYEAGLAAKLGPAWLRLSALHWVNDGFMAVFFLLVGLEIKREVVTGALSSLRQATLPLVAALGGLILPAVLYVAINAGNAAALAGWATPVATDIAFALGVLTLLGSRVPASIKVFLTALAVLDDLFVVAIIAVFYTTNLSVGYLGLAALGLLVLVGFNLLGLVRMWAYLIVGAMVWFCFLRSGVHPTLAGVLVALTIPVRGKVEPPPLLRLEHGLHPWVAWLVIPVFAFANAGVSFGSVTWAMVGGSISLGIVLALFVGKQIGILSAVWLATRLGLADLPEGATYRHIHGVAVVCGVGFTMSLFIGSLAFADEGMETAVKIGVLIASLLSGSIGYLLLRAASPRQE